MRRALSAGVIVAIVSGAALGERAPEDRKDARLVLVGTVKKVTSEREKLEEDGEITYYTATVAVEKVERGKDVKAGEDIKVYWYKVTRVPTAKRPRGSSHPCSCAEKDRARFWINKGSRGWEIIFSSDGVEKLKE
jgi:hypothetical protein